MAKILISIGVLFIVAGLVWQFTGGNIPLGKLPGDIHIKKENTEVFVPITSSILISILLSLLLYVIGKFKS